MTSSKGEYWERWAEEGRDWQGIFSHIDPALASFAEANQMELRRWHWDAPDRTLTWSSQDIQRNLHVYIKGEPGSYSIIIEGSAWTDQRENGKGRRRWGSKQLGEVKLPRQIAQLDASFGVSVVEYLKDGFQQVQGWGSKSWIKRVNSSDNW